MYEFAFLSQCAVHKISSINTRQVSLLLVHTALLTDLTVIQHRLIIYIDYVARQWVTLMDLGLPDY